MELLIITAAIPAALAIHRAITRPICRVMGWV